MRMQRKRKAVKRVVHRRYSDKRGRADLKSLALCNNINGPLPGARLTGKESEVTCGRCLRIMTSDDNDWTIGPDHRSNSSPEFVALAQEVGRIIRGSAHDLLAGQADTVGRLIMAQLAHKHGLVPRHLLEKK